MPRTRFPLRNSAAPYFLTSTVVDWHPLFGRPEYAEIILEALRFRGEEERWTLYAYVLMEHHLHWIVSGPDVPAEVRRFKSYTARRIIDTLQHRQRSRVLERLRIHRSTWKTDQTYQVWQTGSRAKEILGASMMKQKVDYIHQNPVRSGYVDDPTHWRYSSARAYVGEAGLVPVTVAL